MSQAASEIVGNANRSGPKPIETFRALKLIRRPEGQSYSVMAYFMCESHPGKPVAFVINMGNYPTSELAKERAQALVEQTGHLSIFAGPSREWLPIEEKNRLDRTTFTSGDKGQQEDAIRKAAARREKLEQQQREERLRIEKQILEEHANSENPESLDHYIYNWYLLVQSRSEIEYHKEQLRVAEEKYLRGVEKIHKQYLEQPEVEQTWLGVLEERLKERGEEGIFNAIKQGYLKLRPELFATPDTSTTVVKDHSDHNIEDGVTDDTTTTTSPTEETIIDPVTDADTSNDTANE